MTNVIAQREPRNQSAQVIDAVTAGETFVVTRNGEPIAHLRPIKPGRRALVLREGTRDGEDFAGLENLLQVAAP